MLLNRQKINMVKILVSLLYGIMNKIFYMIRDDRYFCQFIYYMCICDKNMFYIIHKLLKKINIFLINY